jgi:hypothetical protein
MALQKRVSELPAVTTVSGTDLLIVSSANATKRTSVQQIGAYFAANGVAGPQGPVGPAGAPGAGGVTSLQGLTGAVTLAAVGGTWAAAGSTLTLTVTSAGAVAWADITGKPATFSPSAHGHVIADVTGLSAALDGKQASGSYAAASHGHVISDVTGLQTALDGKAAVSHTHSASQITDFAAAVAAASPEEVVEYLTTANFPATGNASLLYIATDAGRAYRWVGSQYAEIGPAGAFLPVHSHAASDITSGVVSAARLGSGTADNTTFLRGDGVWQTGPSETFTFFRTTAPSDATQNSTIGTGAWDWTIPNGRIVVIEAVGGGGGGGSGRRWAAGNARFGGGGGGGGSRSVAQYVIADLLTRNVSVIVGGGGAGGAARTTDDTDGANGSGSTGTATSDVRYRGGSFAALDKIVHAGGGAPGNGGGGTGAAGGGAWAGTFASSSGGGSFATANANTGGEAAAAGSGGGGGGGVSAGNVAFNGGAGGRISMYSATLFGGAGGTAPGGAGSNASVIAMGIAGQGGGGGGGNASGAGGNGGNGALPGGGGGGGGASVNGFNSGAGGNGGDGIVRITVWY